MDCGAEEICTTVSAKPQYPDAAREQEPSPPSLHEGENVHTVEIPAVFSDDSAAHQADQPIPIHNVDPPNEELLNNTQSACNTDATDSAFDSNSRYSTISVQTNASSSSTSSNDVVYIDATFDFDHRNGLLPDGIEYREVDSGGEGRPDLRIETTAHDVSKIRIEEQSIPEGDMPEVMKKRQNICNEILESERRYVESLVVLQQLFLDPLIQASGTSDKILSRRLIAGIFSELVGIVNINRELRKRLEDRLTYPGWRVDTGCIGDIFLILGPFMKMYSSYTKNFNNALSIVEEQTAKNAAFASFIKDLLRRTPESHPDHKNLKKALNLIADVAVFVNETIRQQEMTAELLELQKSVTGLTENLLVPGRRLIRKGKVQKICRKNHQTRHLILLSDVLIYASGGILDDNYVFHRKLQLEMCKVIDVPDTQNLQNIFQIVSSEKSFAMYVDTLKEKQDWIGAINDAINVLLKNQSTLRAEQGDDQYRTLKKKKMNEFSAPVWIPDEFAPNCMVCNQEFHMFLRKHHCRACGKVVCHACSSRYFIIPGLDEDMAARACDPCHDRIIKEGKFRVVDVDFNPEDGSDLSSESPTSPDARETLPGIAPRRPASARRKPRPMSMAPHIWGLLKMGEESMEKGLDRLVDEDPPLIQSMSLV
ncbi:hypothetical protein HK104_004641 [Borealophlyctis nickersoniae]|nr:hypothetical protein HK104_004641 [Borealophlyctis nickersoniae]